MRATLALVPALACLLSACQTVDELPTERLGHATLRLASGLPGGSAQLLASGNEVNISIAVAGISPGSHGVYLRAVGACDAPRFETAGDHLNPSASQHGAHLGDLPNLPVGQAGAGTVSATIRGERDEVLAHLFDTDGTAVVVHASADDYRTQPAGGSGDAIACGVLIRP